MPATEKDFLQNALDSVATQADRTTVEARAKLTQDALAPLSSVPTPAELRKVFPSIAKSANTNGDADHLDMGEIETGIKNSNLSIHDRQVLVALKEGYHNYDLDPDAGSTDGHFMHDGKGISADSLTMLDKALNRDLKEDPYLHSQVLVKVGGTAIGFGIGMAGRAAMSGDREPKSLAAVGLVGAFGGALIGGTKVMVDHFGGKNDGLYDDAANTYRNFLKVRQAKFNHETSAK